MSAKKAIRQTIRETRLPRPLFLACVLAVALSLLVRSVMHEAAWPKVRGTVQETRVVADPIGSKRIMWKAEYRVVYSVAGREYSVWADSGVRDEGKTVVQAEIPKGIPPCWVRYNPRRPEGAVANCR